MSRHAAPSHRRLDAAFLDALHKDDRAGEPPPPPLGTAALISSRTRAKDLRTMTIANNRVLLATLSVRQSKNGKLTYLSGWLGKASVVGFEGQPDKWGNPTWNIYVSEPQQKPQEQLAPDSRFKRGDGERCGLADEIPF